MKSCINIHSFLYFRSRRQLGTGKRVGTAGRACRGKRGGGENPDFVCQGGPEGLEQREVGERRGSGNRRGRRGKEGGAK